MSSFLNPILLIDGYKTDHRRQYPYGVTAVYSNWTPRSSRVPQDHEVVYFGGQAFLKRYLIDEFNEKFFNQPVDKVCDRYKRRIDGYLGPNTIGTTHIRELHRMGHLPLMVRAFPEGSLVPVRVPMLTVENTHPDFFWLPNYFETALSCELWLGSTSATTALGYRRQLDRAAKMTGGDPNFTDWQGHDFSFRGMAGIEAATISGAAHLLYFTGTDTLPALDFVEEYYGVPENYLLGGSVAATEHSVMCAGGENSEFETISRLLDLYPSGILSVVSDTWDLWHVITDILPRLKDRIMAREGKYVTRPDSGDPADILCGDPKAPEGSPASKGVIQLLWDIFGGTTNPQGFKMLDPHVGAIYGDSITRAKAEEITGRLAANGFCSQNTVLGIGSYTYQYVTRDTYGFAMKATWIEYFGEGRAIFKDPKTDKGLKKSARGRLAVLLDEHKKPYLVENATPEQESRSLLLPKWMNGNFCHWESYDQVRQVARLALAA